MNPNQPDNSPKNYYLSEANQEEVRFDHMSSSRYDSHDNHAGKGPKNYQHSDVKIFEAAATILKQDAEVDASQIEIYVKDGHLNLEGVVPSRHMKKKAEELLQSIADLKKIENKLNIGIEVKEEHPASIRQSSCMIQLSRQPRH